MTGSADSRRIVSCTVLAVQPVSAAMSGTENP
jgi:hypothetical protein